MFAEMHHGIRFELFPDPEIEPEILRGRRQRGAVVDGAGLLGKPAGRLDPDKDVPEEDARNRDGRLGTRGLGPVRAQLLQAMRGQRPHELPQPGGFQGVSRLFPIRMLRIIRGPGLKPRHELLGVRRHRLHAVALPGQAPENIDRARGRIQPDPVANPAIPVRVIRENQCDFFLPVVAGPQPRPATGQLRDKVHLPEVRHETFHRKLRLGDQGVILLEPDHRGEDAPVDLRQRHVHRNLGRRESNRMPHPRLPAAQSHRRLKDRAGDPFKKRQAQGVVHAH